MSTNQKALTVQEYIDETPNWSDGTKLSDVSLTSMQWRIFWLASAGKFFEGLVVFMTGVALPLIVLEFDLGSAQKGMITAATLFGILIGATALGGLADVFGRKLMFIAEMILFTVFLVLVAVSPTFIFLVVCLFGLGLALGCDYPTAHLVVSESIPSASRGRLVLSAFGFQAVGALAGTIVGFLILRSNESMDDWRYMYAVAIIPAVLVVIGRFFVTQSSHWLVEKGRMEEAEVEVKKLLARKPPYPKEVKLRHPDQIDGQPHVPTKPESGGYLKLFKKKHRRATILASVPWFLQDLGTYGIGIFTPTILAATIGAANEHPRNLAEVIHADKIAAQGAAVIDILLIIGIVFAVLYADKLGRMRLQIMGFIGCAVGLLLAALSTHFDGLVQMLLIFGGFMLFNFMTNIGPNAMTYLIAGEVFPTKIRGLGAGFAASFGKVGAVLTAFFFPLLLTSIGTGPLLYILMVTSLVGAWVTWRFGIETAGMNLEHIGK